MKNPEGPRMLPQSLLMGGSRALTACLWKTLAYRKALRPRKAVHRHVGGLIPDSVVGSELDLGCGCERDAHLASLLAVAAASRVSGSVRIEII